MPPLDPSEGASPVGVFALTPTVPRLSQLSRAPLRPEAAPGTGERGRGEEGLSSQGLSPEQLGRNEAGGRAAHAAACPAPKPLPTFPAAAAPLPLERAPGTAFPAGTAAHLSRSQGLRALLLPPPLHLRLRGGEEAAAAAALRAGQEGPQPGGGRGVSLPWQKGRGGGGGGCGESRAGLGGEVSSQGRRHRDVRQLQQARATRQQQQQQPSQALPRTSPLPASANQKPADASLDPREERGRGTARSSRWGGGERENAPAVYKQALRPAKLQKRLQESPKGLCWMLLPPLENKHNSATPLVSARGVDGVCGRTPEVMKDSAGPNQLPQQSKRRQARNAKTRVF